MMEWRLEKREEEKKEEEKPVKEEEKKSEEKKSAKKEEEEEEMEKEEEEEEEEDLWSQHPPRWFHDPRPAAAGHLHSHRPTMRYAFQDDMSSEEGAQEVVQSTPLF